MTGVLKKFHLCLKTYRQGYLAVKRQNNPELISQIQNTKLQNMIRYCYDNIKYYREEFDRLDIKPDQIKTTSDLIKIPILTRQELRSRFWDFLPREIPPCRISRTSGSTGEPICIFSDTNSRVFNSASVLRYRKALKIGPFSKAILTPLKTANEPYNKKPHWTFLQGIHKTYYINPYIETQENFDYATGIIKKLQKPALIGITPAIRALAYRINDGDLPEFKPSAVLTTGESLSQNVKELLESTFGTIVADIYSCNEAGDIAFQCIIGNGYHINADNCIVEIVKDNKPISAGQIGEVVITNLNRYAMPIIRYKNGDMAKLTEEPCPCGCKLPLIDQIFGRTGEDIILPDGRSMPWNQLKGQMNHPHIRHFQLIQEETGNLTIMYVPEPGTNTEHLENLLLTRYQSMLGASIRIKIKKTDQIPPAPSGKSKLVISNYKPKPVTIPVGLLGPD